MFFSPYFKIVHVYIDRAEQLAVKHRWRHLFGWSVQLTADNETSKSWSTLIISITKDKITDSEAMHFFTTESGRNVVAQAIVRWQPCRRPPTMCSRRTYMHRRPFTWCGVFVCCCLFVSYLFRVGHSTDMCSLLKRTYLGKERECIEVICTRCL